MPGIERDLQWEAAEIDRALDFANLTYGALLGGYIGVILGTENPSPPAMANLLIILFNLTFVMMGFRELTHFVAGTARGPVLVTLLAMSAGTIGALTTVQFTTFDPTLFGLLVAGWLATSLACVAGLVTRRWKRR